MSPPLLSGRRSLAACRAAVAYRSCPPRQYASNASMLDLSLRFAGGNLMDLMEAKRAADAPIQLLAMAPAWVANIVAGVAEPCPGLIVADGALPPADAAGRCLARLRDGSPAPWCLPWLVIDRLDGKVVGGITFKGLPVDGRVEIGYGIAPSYRGRGLARAAVRMLQRLAVESGQVRELIALINPDNLGSINVVSRTGFEPMAGVIVEDGESLVRWTWRADQSGVVVIAR